MGDTQTVLYIERQQIPLLWGYVMIGGAVALAAGSSAWIVADDGVRAASTPALIGLSLVGPAVLILASCLSMCVRVTHTHLEVSILPLLRRRISLEDITSFEPRDYRPLIEYGGWGIRYSLAGHGWAYTICGHQGVQLRLPTRQLLVGSCRPNELASAIRRAKATGTGA